MSFATEDLRRIYYALLGIPPVYLTGFENNDLKQIYDVIAGGAVGMSIGSPITGADPNRILYSDAAGDLAQNAGFLFDESTQRMSIGGSIGTQKLKIYGAGLTSATQTQSWTNSSGVQIAAIHDNGDTYLGSNAISSNHYSYHFWYHNFNHGATGGGGRFELTGFRGVTGSPYLRVTDLTDTIGEYCVAWQTDTKNFALLSRSTDANRKIILSDLADSVGDSFYWTPKAVKVPEATTVEKTAMTNVRGLLLVDSTLGKLCFNTGAGWETVTSV